MSSAVGSRDWDLTRRTVGSLSIGVGTAALAAPRRAAGLLGVRPDAARDDVTLPLLVRLGAARNVVMGAALLAAPAPQARRTTEVALLLTALDAAAVWTSRARGEVAPRSAVLSGAVLALASYGAVRWHRR